MRMLVAAVLFAAAPVMAAAPVLEDVRVLSGPRPAIALRLSAPAEFRARALQADGGTPSRIYIDFAGTVLGASAPRIRDGAGSLLRVRTGQFDRETTRVVLDLHGDTPFEVSRDGNTVTLTLAPLTAAPQTEPLVPKVAPTAEHTLPSRETGAVAKAEATPTNSVVSPSIPEQKQSRVAEPSLAKGETKPATVEPPVPPRTEPPPKADAVTAPQSGSPSTAAPMTAATAAPIAPLKVEPTAPARNTVPPKIVPMDLAPVPFAAVPKVLPPPKVAALPKAAVTAGVPAIAKSETKPVVSPAVPAEPAPFVGPPAPTSPAPTQVERNPPAATPPTIASAFVGPPAPRTLAAPAGTGPSGPRPLTPQDVIVMNAPRPPLREATTTTTVPSPSKAEARSAHEPASTLMGPPAPRSPLPAVKPMPHIAAAPATPLVILDAGHGGRDPGAEGVGGVIEKDVVLELTRVLAKRMNERLHVNVFLTRSDDSYLTIDRRLAVPSDATLFISLHANSCSDPSARGLEIFYGGGTVRPADTAGASPRAALLGRSLGDALSARVGGVRGSARPGSFSILVRNPLPTALVEIGYLTHPEEAALSQDTAYQALMADALVDGLEAFLRATAPRL